MTGLTEATLRSYVPDGEIPGPKVQLAKEAGLPT